ncbi:MAG: hypothetical protein KF866_11810 [Phycisphaeraceae bacterium]|nr:hypothetical protein [Phycisphaeraceae bacterium]MCW5755220.1 hypothetical protein [Phycisphaeraceae bacterium]
MSDKKQYLEHEHEAPDSWHRHSAEEGAPQVEHGAHINLFMLTVIFIIITAFLVVTVAGLIVYFDRHTTKLRQQEIENTILAEQESLPYRDQSQLALSGYAWSDQKAGKVHIPIEEAMKKVVQQYEHTTHGTR